MNYFKASIVTCIIRGVGLFWALLLCIGMLVDIILHGKRVWVKKNRRRNKRPVCYDIWRPSSDQPEIKWKHCYISARGLRFHYVTSGEFPAHLKVNEVDGQTDINEDGKDSANKPTMILCLHGFPESWFSWRHLIYEFDKNFSINNENKGKTDYFLVAVDLRGFGDSDCPQGVAPYHLTELCADVKGLIHAFGYENCVILGHDWGGVIAWEVVERYPELVERYIVLNCPHPKAGVEVAQKSLKQLLINSWYMYFFCIPKLPEIYISWNDFRFIDNMMMGDSAGIKTKSQRLSRDELDLVKYLIEGKRVESAINYYRALILPFYQVQNLPNKHKSRDADFPILLMWGELDVFMSKETAERTRIYLPQSQHGKPESKIIFVPSSSHWLQQDRPDIVMDSLRDFLAK